MVLRIIDVLAPEGLTDTVVAVAEQHGALDIWHTRAVEPQQERSLTRLLVSMDNQQALLDALQSAMGGEADWRIVLLPVEGTVPRLEKEERQAGGDGQTAAATREELYHKVAHGADLHWNFVLFAVLSTLVAVIGMVRDNVAVIIGAMVIAPLLGPNLAFSLAAALGDRDLMLRSLRTNGAGLGLTLVMAVIAGLLLPPDLAGPELMARTEAGFESIGLALASGAAAALSLITGLSTALVGVMVAVALLPPAAAFGALLGMGRWEDAIGAGMLLAINIVCVNLAAQVLLLTRGVKPRTWYEKKGATQSMRATILVWVALLLVLAVMIFIRKTVQ